MEHSYAQALWRLIDAGNDPKEAVRRIHESLEKSGRVALMPRIARAISRIAERAVRSRPTLTIASETDRNAKVAEARTKLSIPEETIVRIDESLVGGWRYEERGRLVDTSYKGQLLDIYNRATR